VWVTPAYAQDPAVVNSKTIRVRFENDRVRALEAICHRVPMSRCTHTPPLATLPGSIDSLNNLAWVLATFPDTWISNGARALALAERANQLSGDSNPAVLRTLAAAYAENGRFTEARVIAERGLELANAQENPVLANII
jgi:Flp pilus assembly protein TadD